MKKFQLFSEGLLPSDILFISPTYSTRQQTQRALHSQGQSSQQEAWDLEVTRIDI